MADGTQNQTEAKGPLNGVRIIDLTQFVLGPYATQTLGDLGADVIKVEEPGGDRQRKDGKPPNLKEMGPSFIALNRNKRSVALDLKSEDGKAALRALVLTGDIFIHNMRPSAIARLGFSYEAVKAIKPDIVYVEAMGYAEEGPYAGLQAFDDLIQSASGACSLNQLVNPEAELRPLPSIIADKTCCLFATIATLAALRQKEQTGEGQYVAVPMLETFTGFLMAEHLYNQTFVPPTGHYGHTTTITPISPAPVATRCLMCTTAQGTCSNWRPKASRWKAMKSRSMACVKPAPSAPRHLQHDLANVGGRLHQGMRLGCIGQIEHLVNDRLALALFE